MGEFQAAFSTFWSAAARRRIFLLFFLLDAPDKSPCGGKLISLPVTNVPRIGNTGKLISLPPRPFLFAPEKQKKEKQAVSSHRTP